jgi:hypothetical protein
MTQEGAPLKDPIGEPAHEVEGPEDEVSDEGEGVAPAKRCRCGYTRGHVMVSPVGEYTFAGWAMLLVGISVTPTRIRFQCRQCRDVVEETTDPRDLKEIRLL